MAANKFKSGINVQGGNFTLSTQTASRALQLDASGNIVSSSVTLTELGYVSGVTSSIQTQLNTNATDISNHLSDATDAHDASAISNVPSGNLAATDVQSALNELQSNIDDVQTDINDLVSLSGVAANAVNLGTFSGTTIPDNQTVKQAIQALETALEAMPDPMEYKGNWSAATNTPSLADGVGNNGDVYHVNAAGTVDFGNGNITFVIGDKVVYNGATSQYEKWDLTDSVTSVFGRTGAVTAQSGDYTASQVTNVPAGNIAATTVQAAIDELDSEKFASADFNSTFDTRLATKSTTNLAEGTNLYFTDERAQDAVGSALTDTASIDFTYNDGSNQISAAVLPAGVDHDQLANFVANEHIDHSSVSINTNANSGLSGGGDTTASRSLVVDINGTTAETSVANGDEILIYDVSASARRKMTRANFLAGVPLSSAGDINESSFSAANNQGSAADVTGLAFASVSVRSFKALISVEIDATADLYESFEILGVNKGSSFDITVSSVGDDSGIVFSITNAGQIQYTSTNVTGFVSNTIRFRAITTNF